jgi:hypothetical protein
MSGWRWRLAFASSSVAYSGGGFRGSLGRPGGQGHEELLEARNVDYM